jgi:hypothetical protein
MEWSFSDLELEDIERLQRSRMRASELLGLTRQIELSDLQHLLDQRKISSDQTYDLQCLGVALGDIMCRYQLFSWAVIDDEYGRDPTLRWAKSQFHVNALTMISKRVEREDEIDLQEMVRWVNERAEDVARASNQ